MKCSLGIFAYNEEKNIGRLLEAVLNQKLNQVEIDEIFIFCEGSTDNTTSITKEWAKKDKRIQVLAGNKRKGKFSAVNRFLKLAKNEILVMESGDTLPEKETVENLVKPFGNPNVGMTGAHPIAVDNPKTFLGFTTHLLWELHHQLSLKYPKMGEMVAFRRVFNEVLPTAVDEAYIEGVIKSKGLKVVYVPEVIVYNKGPETIGDFLKQRKRIFWGHLHLKEQIGYEVCSLFPSKTLFLLFGQDLKFDFKTIFFSIGAAFLEALGRFLGWWDYRVSKKNHIVWDVAESTKILNHE
jgi:cellulose synthase/poly-beta-1,6-N-acetylglucosamine synthase-like glycosyltransferase